MSEVPSPLPLLLFDNVELGNAARTMAYLQNGLAADLSGTFEIGDRYPCDLLYRIATVFGPSGFIDPATDLAPWYHADFSESADFLGFVLTDIAGFDDSTVGRSAQARLGGIEGAQLGPQRQVPRILTVKGYLVAGSVAGNEYGMRWLTAQLASPDCDQCSTGTLQFWTSCPPDASTDDREGRRILYDVGLTEGPKRTAQPIAERYCDIQEIEFTLVAENPYLYRMPVECLATETLGETINCGDEGAPDICTWLFGPPGELHCCELFPASIGTVGTIITIVSEDGIGGVTIGLYSQDDDCPPNGDPVREIQIERIPVGGTLIIDSAQRKITLIDSGGNVLDGTSQLMLPEGETFDWIESAGCEGEPTCVCVRTSHPCSGGASTTVRIDAQLRER